jgi:hypothetical protein
MKKPKKNPWAQAAALARAAKLSPERRREIAMIAAKAAGKVHRAKAIARRKAARLAATEEPEAVGA